MSQFHTLKLNVKTLAVAIDYTYDTLGRLTAADYSDGRFYHYTYDNVGNRLSQTIQYTYDDAREASPKGATASPAWMGSHTPTTITATCSRREEHLHIQYNWLSGAAVNELHGTTIYTQYGDFVEGMETSGWTRTGYGYRYDPRNNLDGKHSQGDQKPYDQHGISDTSGSNPAGEDFADMFLNWVETGQTIYNPKSGENVALGFSADAFGDARFDWMDLKDHPLMQSKALEK
jgi:YD repeat-containing protein